MSAFDKKIDSLTFPKYMGLLAVMLSLSITFGFIVGFSIPLFLGS